MNIDLRNYKVVVIGGGWTGERDANSFSAKNVIKHLSNNGVNCFYLEIDPSKDIFPQLEMLDADFAFLTVTEEVPIQPFLDALGIPYNGSSNLATALSLNKKFIKTLLRDYGVILPKDIVISDFESVDDIPSGFNLPLIVKPVSSGESCGLSLVKDAKEFKNALREAFKHDKEALVEEYIDGQEITIPVIGDLILPGVKITSKTGVWDIEKKDNLDVEMSAVSDSEIELVGLIKELVQKINKCFDLKSFWRADVIYKNGKLYFLEINTQPCLAGGQTGLIPTSIRSLGWNHYDFLSHVANDVLKNYKQKFHHKIKIVD